MIVRNPGPYAHRFGGASFPVGEDVTVDDALGRFAIAHLGCIEVREAPAVADGGFQTKPPRPRRK